MIMKTSITSSKNVGLLITSTRPSINIHAEFKDIQIYTDTYNTCNDLEKSVEFTSATLLRLMESISTNFTKPFSTLIGNTVTIVVKNNITSNSISSMNSFPSFLNTS